MPYYLPQRKSPRARWHDYTGADYFVTFCTKKRELYFGDVADGKMELSEIGKWALTQIEQTVLIRQNDVEIPMYVVMPNHIHLIVVFNGVSPCRDASNASASNASASNASASNVSASNVSASNVSASNVSVSNASVSNASRLEIIKPNISDARGASLQFGPQSGNLSSVVRGIKSAVTKYAIEHDIPFAWQSRYHDHIIRNQMEMNRIADYIENNPLRWELDRFYKKKIILH
jgi:REP element-mobilizing transposase RayT